jgi:endonuclease/exonuclease/phosphatase (EEP) superfamily protein YafD
MRAERPFQERPSPAVTFTLAVTAAVGVLGLVGAVAGDVHWSLDLAGQLAMHLAVLMVVAAVIAWWLGRWRIAVLMGLVAVLHLARMTPAWWPLEQRPVAGPSFGVVLANVLYSSRDQTRLAQLITSTDPTLVALTELSAPCVAALSGVLVRYPYRVEQPRADAFGIGLYARVPLLSGRLVDLVGVPSVDATVLVSGAEVAIRVVHTMPPVSASATRLRDAQLRQLAKGLAGRAGPVVVLGDLNAAPWSLPFRRLVATAGLEDSRRGRGLQGSWPASLASVFRLPLDHVLLRGGIAAISRAVGPETRSDHLPVHVELTLTSP